MADFIHEAWSWFIIIPSVLGLVYCVVIAWSNTSSPSDQGTDNGLDGDPETMGHVWDEDLREYNNPLPRWWLNLFYLTVAFSAVYLVLYPGLGHFQGILGWSSVERYETEGATSEAAYAPLYANYLATPIEALTINNDAMGTAKRIFSNNCAICHGSDAGGYTGFPDLTDNDWLYGGEEARIKETITNGRRGMMPPWGAALGDDGVQEMATYVYSLTREPQDKHLIGPGKEKYALMCVACHGADGKGNIVFGAPNLADSVWLYGGSMSAIAESVRHGRNGVMPAFGEHLNESQIHLLTAYLKSLGPKSLDTENANTENPGQSAN